YGDAPDRRGREDEGQRIDDECARVSEPSRAVSREERAGGERRPLRRLGEGVGGVEFFRRGDSRQDRRPPRSEEGRGEDEQRAEQVEEPGVRLVNREQEPERHYGADEVAGDHDALAIEPV